MTDLTIIIADDEPLATRRLRILIERQAGLRLIGVARDGLDAVQSIRSLMPDVALIDIEMPGLNGFEILEQLGDREAPIVIFVTAFDHYAARAFEARAVDYLVKPVAAERLYTALDRAREQRDRAEAATQLAEMREIIANLRRGAAAPVARRYEQDFWVRTLRETIRVPAKEVEYIEAERDYVRLHTKGRSFLYRASLNSVEARLDPAEFVRTHRSFIVRRNCVTAIGRSQSRAPVLRLVSGEQVPVGRNYAAQLNMSAFKSVEVEPG
jgi:two-component system LytT family response regulator